jgi:hypothetical protein
MAGPQSKSASDTGLASYKPYKVPDKNRPVSTQTFNQVKQHMQEKYMKEVQQWISFFGEAEFWSLVKKDMDAYLFGFPDNQACFIYYKYKGVLNREQKEKSGGETCTQMEQVQENAQQTGQDAQASTKT